MIRSAKVVRLRNGDRARALLAQLVGHGQTGDDASAEVLDEVEVAHPVGFESKPTITDSLEALIVDDDEDGIAIFLMDKGRARDPLEDGESRMSGAQTPAAKIRIRADGTIEIDAAPGKHVIVNGGAKGAARVDDPVTSGAIALVQAPAPGGPGVVLTFTYTPPGGVPQVAAVTLAGAVTGTGGGTMNISGIISGGSAKTQIG